MNEAQPEEFKNYTRRCLAIFAVIVCGTILMVGASYAPLSSRSLNIALVLAAASFNAICVASYLMHLFTERKLIHVVLAFTGIFVVALFCLTILAAHDVPHVAH